MPALTAGARQRLVEMARHSMAHARAGDIAQAPGMHRVPAAHYTDPQRFERERERIFRRLPLLLALSAELPEAGDYKALDAVGMPVLLSRSQGGEVRAFANVCRHRGARLMPEGAGRARRFVCPYHAWSYDDKGALTGVFCERDFGTVNRDAHRLAPLPVLERAGLVWVIPDPNSSLSIEGFLCGYDEVLASFGLQDWKLARRREIAGPNWKIAYDGYMDLYHLPILHKDTFGADYPNQALYHAFGPHQRVDAPNPMLLPLETQPEESWPLEALNGGVWTIFPHVSIATFDAGVRGVLLSQLFPGARVGESRTVQSYVIQQAPRDAEQQKALDEQWDLLGYVVEQEDYATGLRQQHALASGALEHLTFGRNEGGGQNFHRWVDRLLELDDDALPGAFREAS